MKSHSDRRWAKMWVSSVSLAAMSAGVAMAQPAVNTEDGIVVTATGREAALQTVPLAVTAINADALKNSGVSDLRQLEQLAPSYRFFTGQSTSAGTTAYIRGVGTGGDNPGFESAVGFFIDGVYRNRSGVALGELPDVRRVEVLRGPQGTLFGRNTSAGAISVVTAGPDSVAGVKGYATVGERSLYNGSITFNAPIGDALTTRLDISGRKQDGFINDAVSGRDINDRNRFVVRGQALWDISPDATLRVIADASKADEECCGGLTVLAGPTAAALNAIRAGAVLPVDVEARRMSISPGRGYGESVKEAGLSGQLDWNVGELGKVTSITSYRDWRALRNQDIDFTSVDRAYRDGYRVSFQTFSQELRMQGVSGIVDWLVGGYYSKEALKLTDKVRYGAQAALYTDTVISANTGGAQLNGTSPMLMSQLTTPGFKPNLVGLAYLQQATGLTNAQAALATGAGNTTLRTTYDAIAGAFLAAQPGAGAGQVADIWGTNTDTFALFTHDQIRVSDNFMLTLGLRYNHEKKDVTGNLNSVLGTCNVIRTNSPLPILTIVNGILAANPAATALFTLGCNPAVNTLQNGTYAGSQEDNEFTGTASGAFTLSPDAMLYASYSRGYKAGGYNLDRSSFNVAANTVTQRPLSDVTFKPEFVDSYEIGMKTSPLPGVTFNATGFYSNITDFQLNEFTGINFQTGNIDEVVSRGVELEASARPNQWLTLQGGTTYNEAYFKSPVVFRTESLRAGSPLRQAPRWSVTGAATVNFPVSTNITGLLYLDGRWNSAYRTQTLNRNPATDNDAYAIFNARAGLAHANGWELEVFVQNLTDETYYVGGFNAPEQTGTWAVYPNAPRTAGVTLRGSF
jgi:outer membrane receptor protein involved in Fe transport